MSSDGWTLTNDVLTVGDILLGSESCLMHIDMLSESQRRPAQSRVLSGDGSFNAGSLVIPRKVVQTAFGIALQRRILQANPSTNPRGFTTQQSGESP